MKESKNRTAFERLRRVCSFIFGACAIGLPWILISVIKAPGAGRFIAVLLAYSTGTLVILLYAVNPKHFSGVKLDRRQKKLAVCGCLLLVMVAAGIFYSCVLPMIKDTNWVMGQASRSEWFCGKVYVSNSVFGTSLLLQSIRFETADGQKMEGYLYYSIKKNPQVGKTYEFLVTPESRLILDVR